VIDKQANLKKLLRTEVAVMNNINHPNIMHLYDFLESNNNYYLVMQYCNKGDLENYLSKQPQNFLLEKDALFFLKQIMNGFQVLHKHKIMHRDFKLANLFLNDSNLVIGDFGFAKSGFDMAQTKLGTPLTMAPELHMGVVGL
jgi:serine/threonine protein kinase